MNEQPNSNIIYLELMAEIVSAYVANNPVPAGELNKLLSDTYSTLTELVSGEAGTPAAARPRKPAVPINKSVHHDHLVCLEDGKQFKSLKRHLLSSHGMTPEDYRAKWGLPATYPMTASSYSDARSTLAKEFGLGRNRSKQPQPSSAPAKRGRKPKNV